MKENFDFVGFQRKSPDALKLNGVNVKLGKS
jgi:hypothetical protein